MSAQSKNIWYSALLSEASYVKGVPAGSSADTLSDKLSLEIPRKLTDWITREANGGLAAEHQYISRPFDSGFSATVFTLDRQKYLAIRGTEGSSLSDWITDFGIASFGVAKSQAIDLYRYWRKLTTQAGSPVPYTDKEISYLAGLTQGVLHPLSNASSYAALLVSLSGDRGLGVLRPSDKVIVAGHSLGGHLAQLFARAFPENVAGLYTFNGAGIGGVGAELVERLLSGTSSAAVLPGGDAVNVIAKHGFDFTAGVGLLPQPDLRIFNEKRTLPVLNHSIDELTDPLALYDLFNRISPSLSTNGITEILDASSNVPSRSLESALDQLRRLFPPDGAPISPTPLQDRAKYFENLLALHPLIGPPASGRSVESVIGVSVGDFASRALQPDGAAFRYALQQLSPFVVHGIDYESLVADGALDLLSGDGSQGALSGDWIRDRSELLAWVAARNTADAATIVRRSDGGPSTDYTWKSADSSTELLRVLVNPSTPPSQTAQVFFGASGNDIFEGFGKADRLYGGAGGDVLDGRGGDDRLEGGAGVDRLSGGDGGDRLVGGSGDDQLEGGAGRDLLEGGPGFDTYLLTAADAGDLIADSDRLGRIVLDGVQLAGGSGSNGLYWNGDRTVSYAFAGGTLTIQGAAVIENFRSGDLGIALNDSGSSPLPPPIAGGARIYTDSSSSDEERELARTTPDYLYEYDYGSPLADTFTAGTSWGPHFTGRGGDDRLIGGHGYARLWGGAGDDYLENPGGGGPSLNPFLRHFMGGGAGRDTLIGSDESDALFGDFQGITKENVPGYAGLKIDSASWRIASDLSVIEGNFELPASENALPWWRDAAPTFDSYISLVVGTPSAADLRTYYDDVIEGNAGNDDIVGGAGSDRLDGGAGNDRLFGGYPQFPFQVPEWHGINLAGLESYASTFGTDGGDVISGGEGDDYIHDRAGEVSAASGGAGKDRIDFGFWRLPSDLGHASLDGGAGDDSINLSADSGSIEGGEGDDWIGSFTGSVDIDAGAGNDRIWSLGLWSDIRAGAGDDTIAVVGWSTIDGGPGSDNYLIAGDLEAQSTIVSDDASGSDFDRLVLPHRSSHYDVSRDGDDIVVATNDSLEIRLGTGVPLTAPILTGVNAQYLPVRELSLLAGFDPELPGFIGPAPAEPLASGPPLTVIIQDWFKDSRHRLDAILFAASGEVWDVALLEEAAEGDDLSYLDIASAVDFAEDPFALLERLPQIDLPGQPVGEVTEADPPPQAGGDMDVPSSDGTSETTQGDGNTPPQAETPPRLVENIPPPQVPSVDHAPAPTNPVEANQGGLVEADQPVPSNTRNDAERALQPSGLPAGQVVLADTSALVEALFARMAPPPMTAQRWLDEWLPAGSRSQSSAARTAPQGDAPSEAPSAAEEAPPPDAPVPEEGETLTTEEIARRYDEIDAWLAAHDGSENEIAGAAGALSAPQLPLPMLHAFLDALAAGPSLANLNGVAALGGHSMRSLQGLEGIGRLG